jgi:hypothetical protein
VAEHPGALTEIASMKDIARPRCRVMVAIYNKQSADSTYRRYVFAAFVNPAGNP